MFLPTRKTTNTRNLLPAAPTLTDLQISADAASKNKRRWIDVYWKESGEIYTLSTIYSEVLATYVWKLCAGESSEFVIWEHHSKDLGFVHNLVLTHTSKAKPNVHSFAEQSITGQYERLPAQGTLNAASQSWTAYPPQMRGPWTQPGNQISNSIDGLMPRADAPFLARFVCHETGLLTYPAFLFVLDREHSRSLRTKSPQTVVIVSIDESLAEDQKLSVQKFERGLLEIKRKSDILAHYKERQYAFLFPNTPISAAKMAVRRILKALGAGGYLNSLTCSFGVADTLADGNNWACVLKAAEEAQLFASKSEATVFAYRDLLILGVATDEVVKTSWDQIEQTALVDRFRKELTSPATGVFVLPVFEFLAEHDYRRAVREKRSLSVVLLELEALSQACPSISITAEVLQYLSRIKRKPDILAEFRDDHFALLLPDTPLAGAKLFSKRIKEILERELSTVFRLPTKIEIKFLIADAMEGYPDLTFRPV